MCPSYNARMSPTRMQHDATNSHSHCHTRLLRPCLAWFGLLYLGPQIWLRRCFQLYIVRESTIRPEDQHTERVAVKLGHALPCRGRVTDLDLSMVSAGRYAFRTILVHLYAFPAGRLTLRSWSRWATVDRTSRGLVCRSRFCVLMPPCPCHN